MAVDHKHTTPVIRNTRHVAHRATEQATKEKATKARRRIRLAHLTPGALFLTLAHVPGGHTFKEVFLFHLMDWFLVGIGFFKALAHLIGQYLGIPLGAH